MKTDLSPGTFIKLSFTLSPLFAVLMLGACSHPKPPPPPVLVTHVSPGQPSEAPSFGAEVIVDSIVTNATVLSINSLEYEIALQLADQRIAKCKSRPGIKDFRNIKVGDKVTIAIGEERALALGNTPLPDSSPSSERVRVRLPEGTVALADATETKSFTAKIAAIDPWNRIVTLQLPNGGVRSIQTTVAVNLADFKPGDEVSVRITEVVVLIVQAGSVK